MREGNTSGWAEVLDIWRRKLSWLPIPDLMGLLRACGIGRGREQDRRFRSQGSRRDSHRFHWTFSYLFAGTYSGYKVGTL
ncbi:hypothetical protein SODALDRAFT_215050 [Sodiomyces alkalinus F11]|uniref:Uncharacterized protein n=1 Tax=Sodiomyces alkalinus (strain CBS 110278 / VKM F-3762 / F11) TaxID=1314773 RepID=A0A3N2PP69_SODAK|nr:hypothetical protein SODALDRAFT_215050 [Sodiomyces alkalinus F11]ROT36230.1 hypothetical protein SODALDRAFT_215050 [Sodiomyces alkalinus F11]